MLIISSVFLDQSSRFSLESTDGKVYNRGRKTIGIKTIGILDGFIQYDQSHYLAQLQQKYPTCEQLNKAFPSIEMEENSQNSNLVSSWKLWWAKLISQIKSWF